MKLKSPSWYKVTINHGPGHQSQTMWYEYSTIDYIHDKLEYSRLYNPIAKIRRIAKLPVDIKANKISEQKAIIKKAKSMLTILEVS